jgi:tetratricopeptide (TPR) repeat protein
VPQLHFGWSDLRVARAGNYKLILAPRPELYDLRSDPAELQNLIAEARPQARLLIDQLALLRQKEVTSDETGAPLPPEQLAKLRALGYLGSTERATTRDPGADPKDKIADFRLANELIRGALEDLAPRPADAVAKLERLLDRGIESAEIHLALARGYLALRQFARAAEAAQDSVTRAPLGRDAWLILAEARLQLKDRAGGLKTFNDAFEFLPRDGTLFREYGQVLKRLGELKQAHDAFAAATRWAPEDGLAWALHGEALRDRGAIAEGIVALEKSVALAPDRASFWNVLGMTLGGAGRLADAERAFGKALELEPRNPLVIFNLGLALERQGRAEEAQRRFAETLELAPNFAPAKAKIGAS